VTTGSDVKELRAGPGELADIMTRLSAAERTLEAFEAAFAAMARLGRGSGRAPVLAATASARERWGACQVTTGTRKRRTAPRGRLAVVRSGE